MGWDDGWMVTMIDAWTLERNQIAKSLVRARGRVRGPGDGISKNWEI